MTSYIPLLAIQQRTHRIGYDMPVRDYASGIEAAAASTAARARLREPLRLQAPKPAPVAGTTRSARKPRKPHDVISVSLRLPFDLPLTPVQIIIRETCLKHGCTVSELFSARRAHSLVAARHEAMHRMSKETTMSLPAIGRRLGGRDHTTVIHGIRKYEAKLRGEVYVRPSYGRASQASAQ